MDVRYRQLQSFIRSIIHGIDQLFGAMMREANQYDPHIKQAIQRIRGAYMISSL
jgi:hypothetical protein